MAIIIGSSIFLEKKARKGCLKGIKRALQKLADTRHAEWWELIKDTKTLIRALELLGIQAILDERLDAGEIVGLETLNNQLNPTVFELILNAVAPFNSMTESYVDVSLGDNTVTRYLIEDGLVTTLSSKIRFAPDHHTTARHLVKDWLLDSLCVDQGVQFTRRTPLSEFCEAINKHTISVQDLKYLESLVHSVLVEATTEWPES